MCGVNGRRWLVLFSFVYFDWSVFALLGKGEGKVKKKEGSLEMTTTERIKLRFSLYKRIGRASKKALGRRVQQCAYGVRRAAVWRQGNGGGGGRKICVKLLKP